MRLNGKIGKAAALVLGVMVSMVTFENSANATMPIAIPSSAWINEAGSHARTREMLLAGDFANLETMLTLRAQKFREAEGSEQRHLAMLDQLVSTDSEVRAAIERWAEAMPHACNALTVLAMQRLHIATLFNTNASNDRRDADTNNSIFEPLRQAITRRPDCIVAYAAAARALDRPGAMVWLERGLGANPKSALLRAQFWFLEFFHEQTTSAELNERLLDLSQEWGPGHEIEALKRSMATLMADEAGSDNDPVQAVLLFEEALSASALPDNVLALVTFYFNLGWMHNAMTVVEAQLEAHPEYRTGRLLAADIAERLHDRERFVHHLTMVLEDDPGNPDVLIRKARFHSDVGEPEKALPYIERALRVDRQTPTRFISIANMLLWTDRERARSMLDEAKTKWPASDHLKIVDINLQCLDVGCAILPMLSTISGPCARMGYCHPEMIARVEQAWVLQETDPVAAQQLLSLPQ